MHDERIPAAAEAEADATVLELLTGEPVLLSVDELAREIGDRSTRWRGCTPPLSRTDSATSSSRRAAARAARLAC